MDAAIDGRNPFLDGTPAIPFWGVRESGFGRETGRECLLEFTTLKTVQVRTGRRGYPFPGGARAGQRSHRRPAPVAAPGRAHPLVTFRSPACCSPGRAPCRTGLPMSRRPGRLPATPAACGCAAGMHCARTNVSVSAKTRDRRRGTEVPSFELKHD
jgi:hypothetical protein